MKNENEKIGLPLYNYIKWLAFFIRPAANKAGLFIGLWFMTIVVVFLFFTFVFGLFYILPRLFSDMTFIVITIGISLLAASVLFVSMLNLEREDDD